MTHFTLTPAPVLNCLTERRHFKAQWMKIGYHQTWAVGWTSIHHALVCKWLLVCFSNNRFLRFRGSGRRVSFQNKVTVLSLKGNHHFDPFLLGNRFPYIPHNPKYNASMFQQNFGIRWTDYILSQCNLNNNDAKRQILCVKDLASWWINTEQ